MELAGRTSSRRSCRQPGCCLKRSPRCCPNSWDSSYMCRAWFQVLGQLCLAEICVNIVWTQAGPVGGNSHSIAECMLVSCMLVLKAHISDLILVKCHKELVPDRHRCHIFGLDSSVQAVILRMKELPGADMYIPVASRSEPHRGCSSAQSCHAASKNSLASPSASGMPPDQASAHHAPV